MLPQSLLVALTGAVCLLLSAARVDAAARLEPVDGKMILSAWLDTEDKEDARDRFSLFNTRVGKMAGAFQLTQDIPLTANPFVPGDFLYANMTLFDEGSNAALFLTVYPQQGFAAVTDKDVDTLATQVFNITKTGRNVFIRYAPEMQGNWMAYGQQPTEFIASFRKVATAIHQKVPTGAAMVWSPNLEQSSGAESIFSQYYPGDDYVDWVGLSVYWKGPMGSYPWVVTEKCPTDFMAQIIDGLGGEGPNYSFYNNYAKLKNKPFVISEGAAAYHISYRDGSGSAFVPTRNVATQLEVQQTFYDSFLFSATFRAKYPLFKMFNLFEFKKPESDNSVEINRDFRVSVNADTLAYFKAALDTHADAFAFASPMAATTSVSSTAAPTTAAPTNASSTTVAVTTASKPSGALGLKVNVGMVTGIVGVMTMMFAGALVGVFV
ncbi:hypothetical protein HDU97_000977 [Phlyctochytrium planicorne]|nr:hypothetical protein HDU97_000977 [Phlyctochytrium planicorne]